MKYFWKKTNGLNEDIQRHRAEEQRLKDKIAALDPNDPLGKASIRTYMRFLSQLEQSKAEVVSKIGRKK